MCGIVGIVARSDMGRRCLDRIEYATQCLSHRGPDNGAVFSENDVALGHRRLSVIDTSAAAHQPMSDASGRYVLVYNGEIYNYKEIRETMRGQGVEFKTHADSEVLVELFAREGAAALDRLNGFFAFAVYDRVDRCVFVARDRLGIKPLHLYCDEHCILFASELSAILALPVDKTVDYASVYHYLQLCYIPAPHSILARGRKLEPGCYAVIKDGAVDLVRYYDLPRENEEPAQGYEGSVVKVREMLSDAVARRLVSDVPLGSFLSGGLDSTAVAAFAARHTDTLQTFSIGFPDAPRYDETDDARAAARHIGSQHTVFNVREDDLYEHVFDMLDGLDEPFADPSALAVYILSLHTRRRVKVALSGDGADELFGGYNKHRAEYAVRRGGLAVRGVSAMSTLWKMLPAERHSAAGDRIRQLRKLAAGVSMTPAERYWTWCTFADARMVRGMMSPSLSIDEATDRARRAEAWHAATETPTMNDVFSSDMQFVLPHNMLHKVDAMSMAHGLEVRVPFLDHQLVAFVNGLDPRYKLDGGPGKRILRDALAGIVPAATLGKSKHGFDVPLMRWFQTRLRSTIETELLGDEYIRAQGVFDPDEIRALLLRLFSRQPGDIERFVWALVVLQRWWQRRMSP